MWLVMNLWSLSLLHLICYYRRVPNANNKIPREKVEVREGKRVFDKHSGTGRGSEMKKDGHGKGNWDGTVVNPADIPTEEADKPEEATEAPAQDAAAEPVHI